MDNDLKSWINIALGVFLTLVREHAIEWNKHKHEDLLTSKRETNTIKEALKSSVISMSVLSGDLDPSPT